MSVLILDKEYEEYIQQKEEISRLNKQIEYANKINREAINRKNKYKNIIDELEKALKSHKYIKVNAHYGEYYVEIDEVLNYIEKLKEGK